MVNTALEVILYTGLIAILRAQRSDKVPLIFDALRAGGVRAAEVTLTTPDALTLITQTREQYGDALTIGAGTVLDPESARAAILAGAQFIVTPTLNLRTIELCRRYSITVIPGAYTPTEILSAWEAGADIVKLFPADSGGPTYLKAIKAPLPHVRIAPTGGVDETTTAAFLRAGASALGVGSALVSQKLVDADDYTSITERAQRLRAIFDAHREQGA